MDEGHTHGGRRWSGPSKSVEGREHIWAAAQELVGLPGWEDEGLVEALKDVLTALQDKPNPSALVRMLADGWTVDDLAMTSISRSDVVKLEARYGAHIEVYRLHREGLSLNEIVKVTGSPRTTVKERLRWMGVEPRLDEPHATAADMAWVRELRADGLTYTQIADATGFSTDRVRNALRAKT